MRIERLLFCAFICKFQGRHSKNNLKASRKNNTVKILSRDVRHIRFFYKKSQAKSSEERAAKSWPDFSSVLVVAIFCYSFSISVYSYSFACVINRNWYQYISGGFATVDDAAIACVEYSNRGKTGLSKAQYSGFSWFNEQYGYWLVPFDYWSSYYKRYWGPNDTSYAVILENFSNNNKYIGASNCTSNVGNPIQLIIGNKFQFEEDGNSENSLNFRRYYNSADMQKSGTMGFKWRSIYGQKLIISIYSSSRYRYVTARRSAGNDYPFSYFNDRWVGDTDLKDQLIEINPNGVITGWKYIVGDGSSVEFYTAQGYLQSIQHASGLVETISTDSQGRVLQVADQYNNHINFTYDSSSRINSYTDIAGAVYKYAYNNNGMLSSAIYPDNTHVTDSDNPTRQYLYGEFGAASTALTGIIDERGVRYATWKYDTQGRANFSAHGDEIDCGNGIKRRAEEVNIVYNTDGSATVTTHTSCTQSKTARYYFSDINGYRKLSHIDGEPSANCPSDTRSWTYDANGFEDLITNKNGIQTDLDHNAIGQEVQRIEAVGTAEERTITTSWDAELRLPAEIVEPLKTTTFDYDSSGKLLAKTVTDTSCYDSGSRSWTYTYYPNGLLHTVDGPRADVADITTYDYTANGFLSSVTNALGHVTTITAHTASGLPATIDDANGITTTMTYTTRGWLSTSTTGGLTTSYDYDAIGQLIHIAIPDGSEWFYDYDDARRLMQIRDGSNPLTSNRIDYTRDLAGNITNETVTDSSGTIKQIQQREFDELNRLLKTLGQHSQQQSYQYDAEGNLTGTSNVLGNGVTQAFDGLNRLASQTDTLNNTTRYSYDGADQLATVTDPRGKITTYHYDGLGNLLSVASPDSSFIEYTYDAAGNRISETNANLQGANYQYDALNRLIQKTAAWSGEVTTFTYDQSGYAAGIGELTLIQDANSKTTFSFDGLNRLFQKRQYYGTSSTSLLQQYGYDSQGRIATLRYPSGSVITYSYASNGQLTQLSRGSTVLLNNLSYFPFGSAQNNLATQWSFGGSNVHQRTRDTDGRQTRYKIGSSYTTIGYDEADHISALYGGNTSTKVIAYDELDRLTDVTNSNSSQGSQNLSYDANGNRTQLTVNNTDITTYTLSPSNNRITKITRNGITKTQQYDSVGNLKSDGTTTFNYNANNRLATASSTQSGITTAASYTYNPLGQRIKKVVTVTNTTTSSPATVTSSETRFMYDPQGHLIGEYSNTNALISEYVYLGDQPVAIIKPDGIYYVQTDHLGTPRGVLNSTNVLVWKWDSVPFGETLPNEDADGNGVAFMLNLRMAGQYFDKETGLFYNGFRDYDPKLGRYIQSDPRGQLLDFSDPARQVAARTGIKIPAAEKYQPLNHMYVYVGSNPLMRTDSTGEEPFTVGLILWGIAYYNEAGDYIGTPEGNRAGGLSDRPQDMVCSSAASPLNVSPHAKECCAQHDQCYEENNCNQSSWVTSALGGTKSCNQCNSKVVRGILGF